MINGTLIFDDKSGVANNAITNFDISSLLVQGANLIAFHVIDYGGNRFGGVRLDADEIISNVPEASAAILWGALTISASGLVCWRRMAEGRAAHAGLAER